MTDVCLFRPYQLREHTLMATTSETRKAEVLDTGRQNTSETLMRYLRQDQGLFVCLFVSWNMEKQNGAVCLVVSCNKS